MSEQQWSHKATPANLTVLDHIKKTSDWDAAVTAVGGRQFIPDLPLNLDVDHKLVLDDVHELYRDVGAIAWASQKSLILYGMAINYNPIYPEEEWKSGLFGDSRYAKYKTYDYYKAVDSDVENRVKDDYLDSLGFRKILPAIANKKHLGGLLGKFKHPVVRSSIRTINGSLCRPSIPGDGGMHTDDSPFEVLRINICLSTNGDFGMQYENQEPFYWYPGQNLIVNTDVPHRSYVKKHNDFLRTNLVIGITPWLNYDETTDTWSLNEYFGKLHPYDMVKQGLII